MKDFSKQAFSAYKENLAGLPSFCRLVMLEVFEYCDHQSGTISINSLDKLASNDFHVDPLRGRQKEVINGDTIRNAFRTIKKAKPDHFKFTTVNQRIVIDMPFLRELHPSIYNEAPKLAAVLASDVAAATNLIQLSESVNLDSLLAADVSGVPAAASLVDEINAREHSSAKIKPNKIKPNNNSVSDDLANFKKPITDDFFPSQFVIDKALSMGLSKVTDAAELKKFILFNQASGSQWKNFDYVYLTWLQRDAEREYLRSTTTEQYKHKHLFNITTSGSSNSGTYRNSEKSRATQRVIAAYSEEFEFCQHTNRFNAWTTANPAPIKYLDIDALGPID